MSCLRSNPPQRVERPFPHRSRAVALAVVFNWLLRRTLDRPELSRTATWPAQYLLGEMDGW